MANITAKTIGVKGSQTKFSAPKKTVGYLETNVDDKLHIAIDSHTGYGDTYMKRENSLINVTFGDKFWTGTTEEFIERFFPTKEVEEPKEYEPKGEFVNDDMQYQLGGYVFHPVSDDEGFSYLDVYHDDNESTYHGEYLNAELPDMTDLESIENFEKNAIEWLKGEGLL